MAFERQMGQWQSAEGRAGGLNSKTEASGPWSGGI